MINAVCAVIFRKNNENIEILSVSRKNNPQDLGLVGGKIENNETILEALVREVLEETGLNILKHGFIFVDWHCITYIVQAKGAINTQEQGNVSWVNIDKICDNKNTFSYYNKQVRKIFNSLSKDKIRYFQSHEIL